MVDVNQVQIQAPDYLGSITRGMEAGQNMRFNNLKMLAAQQEIEQKQAINSLYKLAATGDPTATKQLSMFAPEAAKGLREYQTYKVTKAGQLAGSVLNAPEPVRPKLYTQSIEAYKKEFGETPPVPAEYSPEAAEHLKGLVTQARDVEKVAAEQFETPKREAEIKNLLERTVSEKFQQRKLGAETSKLGMETQALQSERQAMLQGGYTSPTAFKEAQKVYGETTAKARISLPKVEDQAKDAINLINEITSHPGMSDVVGAKNVFSGAGKQYLPNWAGGATPVVGTKAANFEAKLKQLEGKNFLQAFETLKGGGQITEVEGKKATDAIASMQASQSEKEFKKSAQQLKEVINAGLRRARQQGGGVLAPTSQAPADNDPLGIRGGL